MPQMSFKLFRTAGAPPCPVTLNKAGKIDCSARSITCDTYCLGGSAYSPPGLHRLGGYSMITRKKLCVSTGVIDHVFNGGVAGIPDRSTAQLPGCRSGLLSIR